MTKPASIPPQVTLWEGPHISEGRGDEEARIIAVFFSISECSVLGECERKKNMFGSSVCSFVRIRIGLEFFLFAGWRLKCILLVDVTSSHMMFSC